MHMNELKFKVTSVVCQHYRYKNTYKKVTYKKNLSMMDSIIARLSQFIYN